MTDRVETQGVLMEVEPVSGEVVISYAGKVLAAVVIADLSTPGASYWTDPADNPLPLQRDHYLVAAWGPDGEWMRLFTGSLDDAYPMD